MKKRLNQMLVLIAGIMGRHGRRCLNALGGVFAMQKLQRVLLAGTLIILAGCGDNGDPSSPPGGGGGDDYWQIWELGHDTEGHTKGWPSVLLGGYLVDFFTNPNVDCYYWETPGGSYTKLEINVSRATDAMFNGFIGQVNTGTWTHLATVPVTLASYQRSPTISLTIGMTSMSYNGSTVKTILITVTKPNS